MIPCDWRFAFTRIQIEYIEMPDLMLSFAQIRRLCDLPLDVCVPAVAALEEAGFLWRAPDGRYVRRALGRAGREISEPGPGAPAAPGHLLGPLAVLGEIGD
jgi:hypothetical protein